MGVFVRDPGTAGRLEGCTLWANGLCGVFVVSGGDPSFAGCTVRDHASGLARGIYVADTARGKAKVGADCVFMRNAGGDVVRE